MENTNLLKSLIEEISQTNSNYLKRVITKVSELNIDKDNFIVTFYVSNTLNKEILEDNISILKERVSTILGGIYTIKIELKQKQNALNQQKKILEAKKINEENNQTKPIIKETINPENPRLNPIYTLDNFIPGENSRFAYNVARAIASNPASEYNPFLIYSNVGLGKTHLAEAIGNEIQKTLKYKVIYVTCEYFINEFMKAIQNKTIEQYKNIYRNVDVLIIDDVQFLEGKPSTQEALFNIFNSLKDSNKQMIFTSDRPINAIKEFQPRLSTRLNSGVAADLQPPPFETKVAILRSKCQIKNYKLDDEIIFYIAENITSNVRDLEACLSRLVSYSNLLEENITIDKAKTILKDLIFNSKDKSNISMDKIIKAVADYYDIPSIDIRGKKRNNSVSKPRHVAFYLAHTLTDFSSTEIGTYFGNRDHSTILHSINKVTENIKNDSVLAGDVALISNNILRES